MQMRMMRFINFLFLLVFVPSISLYPQNCLSHVQLFELLWKQRSFSVDEIKTYDDAIWLIERIESGKLEKKASVKELEKINGFLAKVAWEGCLPDESQSAMEADIAALSLSASAYSGSNAAKASAWQATKKFIKKHRKAIIIGIVIVVVIAVVVTVVILAGAPAAAVAAGAGAAAGVCGSDANGSDVDRQIEVFKESVAIESAANPNEPIEETGRRLGSLFTHDSISPASPSHHFVDEQFNTNYSPLYIYDSPSFNPYSYQSNGEAELLNQNYTAALNHFEKAIDLDPTNAKLYLDRSVANLASGNYNQSTEDYMAYQKHSLATTLEFGKAFVVALPEGIYESGKDLAHLGANLATHPIRTSGEVYASIMLLSDLAKTGEWLILSETLAPEIYELITDWDHLSPSQRGQLAGYAFGKYGADIILPGATCKAISKTATAAKTLRTAHTTCKLAEQTLVLESAAGTNMTIVVEDLGTTVSEIQAGSFNTTTKTLEHLTPEMQASYNTCYKAETFLKPYKGAMPETKVRELIHQTGFPTFPRPKGIPDDYIVTLSDRGAGMKYVDPKNSGTSIRVMPGKPHSPLPHQQKPYIIQMEHGKTLDKFGNVVPRDVPEAHIPIDEFVYKGN
jgi:tetratricopeptide (TPR) repeat protein